MSAAEEAAAVRRAAGLFRCAHRGLVAVEGPDRVRWLDGMLTRSIAGLEPGAERSGCRALLLTRKGGIVADLQVWLGPEALWLELEAARVPALLEALGALLIADDARLRDIGAEWEHWALEGPRAAEVLAAAAGRAPPALAPDACAELEVAGGPLRVAVYPLGDSPAHQLLVPAGRGEALAAALQRAGAPLGLVEAGPAALEVRRIEAGRPRDGAELAPDTLPAEAGLEGAVDFAKGCFVGQEIAARVRSRGQVRHRLVGLRLAAARAAAPGSAVLAGSAAVGEVTSSCVSADAGAIALAYLRVEHAAPGGELRVEGRAARVSPLPFALEPPG